MAKRDVLWVERKDQLETASSPVRFEIIDRLSAMGPLSVRDLAAAIGRRPTSIYHHLRQLEAVGLIRQAEVEASAEGGEPGRPAVLYETVAPLIRLARAAKDPANRETMTQAARSMTQIAARDYAKGFDAAAWTTEGKGRNHWFFRVVSTPSPERLARINALLDEVVELLWTPDPNPGPPVSLAGILAPAGKARRKAISRS